MVLSGCKVYMVDLLGSKIQIKCPSSIILGIEQVLYLMQMLADISIFPYFFSPVGALHYSYNHPYNLLYQ